MSYYYGNYKVLILFVVTWLYLWLRAIYVPIVHDEAATFFIYIQTGQFLPWHSYADANNHLLNSALSFLSVKIFGGGILALRLPNLLMWPVYFFSVFFIAGRIQHKILRLVFFLGMILAHNFIEFFGLCRGYGMSMGFLMLSVLFLIKTFERGKNIDRFVATMSILLALASNLTLVNSCLMILLLVILSVFLEQGSVFKKLQSSMILIALISFPMYYFLKWMFFLKSSGLLYYHSVEGFMKAVPGTLGYLLTGVDSAIIPWIMVVLFVVVIVLAGFTLYKTWKLLTFLTPGIIFTLLLAGNLMAMVAGHFLLGVYYPEDRTALYLFPFLFFSLVFLIDNLTVTIGKWMQYLLMLILIFFPAHFIYTLNVNHSSLWHEEGIPKNFYTTIVKSKEKDNRIPTLGGYMLRRFCWGFMNYEKGGELPMIKTTGYPEMYADYQIVHMNKPVPWLYRYKQIAYDPSSGLSLLERKPSLKRQLIYKAESNHQPMHTEAEYFSLFEKDIDSLGVEALFVEVSFQLKTEAVPFQSAVIASINDSSGQNVAYESIELNWYHYRWNDKDTSFHQGLLLTRLPEGLKHLTVYIVNALKKKYTINQRQVKVYALKENQF